MLFDEPGDKLDMPFQQSFLQAIKDLGKTVLFSIHEINVASIFAEDFLLSCHRQIIAQHTPEKYKKDVIEDDTPR